MKGGPVHRPSKSAFVPIVGLAAFATLAALAATGRADNKSIDASKCLETKVEPSQEIGNVFSRTISYQVEGFDALVKRVSGTGIYKVQKVTPEQMVMTATFLYDGRPAATGENIIKDGGRTICWNGKCSPATDASGVTINPFFWGAAKGKLHAGQSWEVEITVPWELGPAGKQVVRVVSVDPSNDTITLERKGEGEGDDVDQLKKLSLVKEKKTYSVDVSFGKTTWRGYTTFRRGVVLSDVLLVERSVKVSSTETGESSGSERQYVLLNAAPPESLVS
jgi:hypothetical protein